ncbi:hypothetical protein HHX47_DHR7000784 [Lentinula edodes]|nr:hypothetical protein HHX47_DHR7000784 [Lentinula edodes]
MFGVSGLSLVKSNLENHSTGLVWIYRIFSTTTRGINSLNHRQWTTKRACGTLSWTTSWMPIVALHKPPRTVFVITELEDDEEEDDSD